MNLFNDFLPSERIEQNDFTNFVLSDQPFSTGEVCEKLLKDPSSVALLLKSERNKALFLSDLSGRIPRLLQLLSHISAKVDNSPHSPNDGYKIVVEYMINDLALPLVELQEIHETRGLIELLICLTGLAYSTRGRARRGAAYKTMLRSMSHSIALMIQMLPHREGGKLMQKILSDEQASIDGRVVGSAKALALWAQAAVHLCRDCRAGHSVSHEIELWDRLIKIRDSLSAQVQQANYLKANQTGTGLPQLSNMRALSKDDKKSGVFSRHFISFQYDFMLSPEELSTLQAFTKREMTSVSAVESILEEIESKAFFHIFLRLVKTFPCAVCLAGKQYTSAPQIRIQTHGLKRNILPDNFSRTLFGDKLGPWQVCLSDQAFKDLISANKEGDLVAIANKLKQIASGQWDRTLIKPLGKRMRQAAGRAVMKVPLWRAAYGSNGRILWQINVAYEEDCDSDSQIITVWRIGNKQEICDAVKAVLQLQKLYSRSDIDKRKVWLAGADIIFPQILSTQEDSSDTDMEEEDKALNSRAKAKLSDSDITAQYALMNNKFYSMTGKILDRLFSTQDSSSIEVPFKISRKETEIIKHANTAAFILGRSGTGKTTCLLYKLLSRYIASKEHNRSIRQIFLTRSSYLADRLNDYLKKLVDTQTGQRNSTLQRPSLSTQVYSLRESQDPLYGVSLYNVDDEQFPMVSTFDQFLTFIEKCIKTYDRQNFSDFQDGREAGTISAKQCRLIDYGTFRKQYWPAMSHLAGFEVDQIFAEILGVIKGSTSAKRDLMPLSRGEYLTMSTRVAPVFTKVEDRERVYTVYETYERKKARLGDQDDIDRVVHILRALEAEKDLKTEIQSLFDEVYVDELQDQKLLEIDLLLTVVRNPHGIHFAGDTAQCISRDSTFRFQDVKARFFQHFEDVAKASSQPSVSRPELFRLLKNYRSHQGILSLAADIVDMLCNGFPGQIDKLPRETGSDEGALPIVFSGFNATQLARGGAGLTGTQAGLSCFGAEQVILVRDDSTKEQLQKILPSTLILTILQSKGLEFEDVVLFNFFTNSNWDAVNMKTLKALSDPRTGQFDIPRYAWLCSELKHLYVAVTRARENLWIIEDDRKAIQNILTIWRSSKSGGGPLVTQIDESDPNALSIALSIIKPGKSSRPEAWIKQGEVLLQRQLYHDALRCFVRAGHKQGQNLAKAHILYEKATAATANGNSDEALYREAGGLFEQAGFYRMASGCWSAVGEFKKAGDILKSHSEYGRAAPLYEKGKNFAEAAQCYDLVRQYDDAVIAYRKGELFNELIKYLQLHKDDISQGVRTRYSALSNILLQRRDPRISAELLPAAKEGLGNEKAQESFYESFGYTKDLSQLHISRKDYKAAFNLALKEGKYEEALELSQNLEAASVIPTERLLALYNCLQAQRLWSYISVDKKSTASVKTNSARLLNLRVIDAFKQALTSPLHAPNLGWNRILSVIGDCSRSGKLSLERPLNDTSPVAEFMKTWGNEIFDLYELLNLINTEKLQAITHESEFPVESLARFAHMVGDILIGKAPYTNILPLFGILEVTSKSTEFKQAEHTNDGDSVVHILRWSPLYPETDDEKNYSPMSLKQAYTNIENWLINQVARIGSAVLAHFHSLIRNERRKQICVDQLLKGHCARKLLDNCHYIHKIPNSRDIKIQINSLCRLAGLVCSFTRIYYRRKFDEDASKRFQKLKRSILETLLAQLTFVSSSLHDLQVQEDAWSLIMTHSPGILSCKGGIADLFFYRLRRDSGEWNERGYLSALLEERDLASRLGVLDPFGRRVWTSSRQNWECLRDYTAILGGQISHKDFYNISQRMIKYYGTLATQRIQELTVFHATLSLFESIALGLLMRTTKQDILIPLSLKNKLNITTTHIATDGHDRDKLNECLVSTLTALCYILKNIGSYSANFGFQFTVCGRPLNGSRELLIRRALDFLGICMANMGVGCVIPNNFYNGLWVSVVEVHKQWRESKRKRNEEPVPLLCVSPSSIDWESMRKADDLPSKLLQVYKAYDKDALIVIEGLSPRPQPSRFQSILDAGITLHPRKAVLGVVGPAAPAIEQPIATQTGPTATFPVEQGEVAAVKQIWEFWKKYYPLLQQKRSRVQLRAERLLTPDGTAKVIIEDILPFAYPSYREILKDCGIPLLTAIFTLQGQIESLHAQAKERLTSNRSLTIDHVEKIQEIFTFISNTRKEIQDTIDGFKAGKGRKLRKMPIDQLEKKLRTAIKYLEKLQKRMVGYEMDMNSED